MLRLADGAGAVVARVAMATSMVRVGMAWLRREVELTGLLDREGCEVTRPTTRLPAGPFERDGFVVSFWEEETLVAGDVDPSEAGARLRAVHRTLAACPAAVALPRWGAVHEAREVHALAAHRGVWAPEEIALLERAWARADVTMAEAEARTASMQPVHGDAHVGNVLSTARGAVWTDFEDAFLGPVEWDLACLRSKAVLFGEQREIIDAVTRAYGTYDEGLTDALGQVRNLQVVAWLAIFAERQPELLARMRARLALVDLTSR